MKINNKKKLKEGKSLNHHQIKSILENNIQMALQRENIDIEDAIDLREIKNIKLANQLLKIRRKRKMAKDQQMQQENMAMQVVPQQTYLGPLGMTGHTAYIGLFKIGKLKKNQTVLVSSAAGSVGSIVCQIAKINGCKVIASTGSDKKVKWLIEELGVDHAFNYKKVENLVLHLKSLSPEGYDLYFDNVGGDFLEAAIFRMKNYGRIVICGRISQMNATSPGEGLKNMAHVLVKRLTIKGFLIFDHENDSENFQNDMSEWLKNKKIVSKETIYEGLSKAPKAFVDLLKGKNIGKMLIKI